MLLIAAQGQPPRKASRKSRLQLMSLFSLSDNKTWKCKQA